MITQHAPSVIQHYHPEGHQHHRVVVAAGPVPESGAAKTPDLDPLTIALAVQRCVPECFPRGANATIIGRRRAGIESGDLEHVIYVRSK